MLRRTLHGAVAGAAGTTALNALTYLDMLLRGRPSSSTPEQTVDSIADAVGLRIPGDEDSRDNRRQGLGALLGIVTGITIGAALGALDGATHGAVRRLPAGATAAAVTAGALIGANGPMAAAGVSDPRTWSAGDWVSDVVPHIGYGVVTALTYAALSD